jgi:hypothetical protein
MTAVDRDLRPPEEPVLQALLTESTIAGAAQVAGVGEQTFRRSIKRSEGASGGRQ